MNIEMKIETKIYTDINGEELAKKIHEICNKRGEWQPESYKDGTQVEVDDGADHASGIHRVRLEDVIYTAYTDTIPLSDVAPNRCHADIKYRVTVVFSKDQEDYAKNDEGELVAENLDWDNPMLLKVEEI